MQKFLTLLQANVKELARLITGEHGKTLPDAIGSIERGIEVVEFACGVPHLLKGEHSEDAGTAVIATRCGSRSASVPASRHLCFPWRLPAATLSS